eukprot:531683-Pelagomonas_calceolata.AAC.1
MDSIWECMRDMQGRAPKVPQQPKATYHLYHLPLLHVQTWRGSTGLRVQEWRDVQGRAQRCCKRQKLISFRSLITCTNARCEGGEQDHACKNGETCRVGAPKILQEQPLVHMQKKRV